MDSRIMSMRLAVAAGWFKDQAASGLSKKDWCEQNGVCRSKFYYYQHLFQKTVLEQNAEIVQAADNTLAPTVVEVTVPTCVSDQAAPQPECPPSALSGCEEIRITYGSFEIHIPGSVSEQALTRALRAVKHAD